MTTWYSRSLGTSSTIYAALHDLNTLCTRICPTVTVPYLLVIDTVTVETIAFFAPEDAALGVAFGATPCSAPVIDGIRFVDLGYSPLPPFELQSGLGTTGHSGGAGEAGVAASRASAHC